ncbi:MAG: S41 family peptidase [Bacilli bacterium]|nr:S41 family peptidase [Bacilli bacterium]MDD4795555.1 S41 family peptidase [Bacilli bacterium]
MKKTKPTFDLWEVILIALISSLIMSATTGYALFTNNKIKSCSSVTNNENLGEFISTYNSIITEYYKEVDEKGLVNAAINGMVNYLDDPYTTYLDENSKDLLLESLKGEYEGIGVEITKRENGNIEVVSVFENTPASEVGLMVGDVIKSINNVDVAEKTAEDAVAIIKNNKNVTITALRSEAELSFNLEKKTLYIPVIKSNIYERNDQKVGYIRITRFSESVGEQFDLKLKNLEEQGITSLIVDVRNNTGGYLKGSTDIASIFLEDGKVIYSLKSNLDTKHYKDETKEHKDYKVAILINKSSASASEVLAAALKYSYGATLIGTTTYGKGTVQQTSNINDNSMIKYTTAKWLTPAGDCIDGVGIAPDIKVELTLEEGEILTDANDTQLESAITNITKVN